MSTTLVWRLSNTSNIINHSLTSLYFIENVVFSTILLLLNMILSCSSLSFPYTFFLLLRVAQHNEFGVGDGFPAKCLWSLPRDSFPEKRFMWRETKSSQNARHIAQQLHANATNAPPPWDPKRLQSHSNAKDKQKHAKQHPAITLERKAFNLPTTSQAVWPSTYRKL